MVARRLSLLVLSTTLSFLPVAATFAAENPFQALPLQSRVDLFDALLFKDPLPPRGKNLFVSPVLQAVSNPTIYSSAAGEVEVRLSFHHVSSWPICSPNPVSLNLKRIPSEILSILRSQPQIVNCVSPGDRKTVLDVQINSNEEAQVENVPARLFACWTKQKHELLEVLSKLEEPQSFTGNFIVSRVSSEVMAKSEQTKSLLSSNGVDFRMIFYTETGECQVTPASQMSVQ